MASLRLCLAMIASIFSVASAAQRNWIVGQAVSTTSGVLLGHASEFAPDVSEYLGAPFAEPPVGELRWAAPVRFSASGEFNASSFGNACPRLPGNNNLNALSKWFANLTDAGAAILTIQSAANDTFSEDCLTVNVWTKPQAGAASKPVIVFVHGGAFSSGDCSNPFESGAVFADEQDVVFVTFNYRLSIMGFPGHNDTEKVPYNLGLRDQRLAIEWIRDNIAAFSGDPDRITLFGSSAGAASLDYFSYAYVDDPIVSSFIPASGTATSFGAIQPDAAAQKWFTVSETLGCGGASTDPDALLSCMRGKSTDEVMSAIPPVAGFSALQSSFTATVDETLVFADYTNRTPVARPVLIGSNDAEAELFEATAALKGSTFTTDFWATVTHAVFTCPAALRANRSLNAGQPTWRYRFAGASFPNVRLSGNAYHGAWHGSQNVVMFGNARLSGPPDTEAEGRLAEYMRGAWAAFARDPERGLVEYGWPVYDPAERTLVQLGETGRNETGANFTVGDAYDGSCGTREEVTATRIATAATTTATATASSSASAAGPASGVSV
ncbi:Carboxylic ester hydrolase [Pleurostoma richardsiae]|uniref:Carboxylic ester hydrolase n=1 Tax=Pleurostoma richardsiae TaxID=41990 RepID=A0AA38VXU5_9PEZI|nr:Carboxylic ester hydrolase [Pleurostoma richardsiae]